MSQYMVVYTWHKTDTLNLYPIYRSQNTGKLGITNNHRMLEFVLMEYDKRFYNAKCDVCHASYD